MQYIVDKQFVLIEYEIFFLYELSWTINGFDNFHLSFFLPLSTIIFPFRCCCSFRKLL